MSIKGAIPSPLPSWGRAGVYVRWLIKQSYAAAIREKCVHSSDSIKIYLSIIKFVLGRLNISYGAVIKWSEGKGAPNFVQLLRPLCLGVRINACWGIRSSGKFRFLRQIKESPGRGFSAPKLVANWGKSTFYCSHTKRVNTPEFWSGCLAFLPLEVTRDRK